MFLFLNVSLFSQTKTGTLKVFSEISGITIQLDEVRQENYQEIKGIQVGSHYLKATLNGASVYSEIIEIKEGAITTILIKKDSQPSEKIVEKSNAVSYNANPSIESTPTSKVTPSIESAPSAEEIPVINIGQVNGMLPADKTGAFGLTFGMDESTVKNIMNPQAYSVIEKGRGYISFGIVDQRVTPPVPFLVECRFINGKLFQILVGYVTIDINENKSRNQMSINKNSVPLPEYNKINSVLLSQYGKPTSSERTFKGGYADGDGREVEAIKKRQAFIISTWTNSDTGNEVFLTLAYTKAILVLVAYNDGLLNKEAARLKLEIHDYKYANTYKENYNSR